MNTSKAQHTPGPWKNQEGFNTIYTCSNGDDGETIAIAKVIGDQVSGGYEEATANAMLIAASPELLNACEFGNMGMGTIVLLHNAANVLEELGREKGLEGPMQLAASLRKKGELEFAAVEKAVRARVKGNKL